MDEENADESDEPQVIYNPAAGVKSDFGTLLNKFAETNSVRYEEFAKLWCQRKMYLICAGRQGDKECREFIEECMAIAVSFWMPPFTFQARVGGLYLLYGLYFKQVVVPKVKIRLTFEQWKNVQSFLEEVREQQHFDVEYIYHKLRFHRAFQFVAFEKEKNFAARDSSTAEDSRSQLMSEALTQRKSILSEIMEQEALGHLSDIHEQYERLKCAMAGPGMTRPHPSVDIIQPNLVQYITKAVATHEEWQKKKASRKFVRQRRDSGSTSESEEGSDFELAHRGSPRNMSSIGQRRAELKAQAFRAVGTASRSRRHRQALKDTDYSPVTKRSRRQKGTDSGGESSLSQDEGSPSRKRAKSTKTEAEDPLMTAPMDIYAISALLASPDKSPKRKKAAGSPRGHNSAKQIRSPKTSPKSPPKRGKGRPSKRRSPATPSPAEEPGLECFVVNKSPIPGGHNLRSSPRNVVPKTEAIPSTSTASLMESPGGRGRGRGRRGLGGRGRGKGGETGRGERGGSGGRKGEGVKRGRGRGRPRKQS